MQVYILVFSIKQIVKHRMRTRLMHLSDRIARWGMTVGRSRHAGHELWNSGADSATPILGSHHDRQIVYSLPQEVSGLMIWTVWLKCGLKQYVC